MAGNPIYNTKQWRELRKQILEQDSDCHWCRLKGKRVKATSVDHVIEIDAGIDPYDASNLVPSCASCNSSRGARYVKVIVDGTVAGYQSYRAGKRVRLDDIV